MRKKWIYIASLLISGLPYVDASAVDRVEIPITRSVGPSGQVFYSVPVSVGSAPPVEALLDSGSTGLRLLPGTFRDAEITQSAPVGPYAYGTGVKFDGPAGLTQITIGGVVSTGPIKVQTINAVSCVPSRPRCVAADADVQSFGIGGAGLPGHGYRAILGLSLSTNAVVNPLASIGNGMWIIRLPKPDNNRPGLLIISPTPDEVAQFTQYSVIDKTSAVPGCLSNTDSDESICGRLLLDTGAPSTFIHAPGNASLPSWEPGSHAAIDIGSSEDANRRRVAFTIDADRHSLLSINAAPAVSKTTLISTQVPFLAYDVLFDATHHSIGLRAAQ